MSKTVGFIGVFIIIVTSTINAQNYYYSNNRRIFINKSEKWLVVQVPENSQSSFREIVNEDRGIRIKQTIRQERGFYWVESSDIETNVNRIARNSNVTRSIPVFLWKDDIGDTAKLIMFDEIRIKFKPNITRAQIDSMNSIYGVEVLRYRGSDRYLLRVSENSNYNALDIANIYYEKNLAVWSVPNFLADIKTEQVDDPYYANQWYLNDTRPEGVDIDAEQAWGIATGTSEVIVAVVDEGVETHEDFYSGQLVAGYTAGGGDGSPFTNSKHGQAVAGIIGANHNSLGIRGVSPNAKIMSIRVFVDEFTLKPYGDIADAIDWAVANGAQVLNMSWGDIRAGFYDDDLANSITEALTNGRGGKGCVVVKSAGNNPVFVSFPGTVPGVLVVGAVTIDNTEAQYTPRINELFDVHIDVVAPSGSNLNGLPCNMRGNVWTTDRESGGFTPCNSTYYGDPAGKYFSSFTGTSACAPQVSGIAALILRENPNLEARPVGTNPNAQVQTLIKQTATDYGNTEWDGKGRVNAYRCVYDAVTRNLSYSVKSQWNLLSVPVIMNFAKSVVWANSNYDALTWENGNYVAKSTLSNGVGYFVRFPSSQGVTYSGAGSNFLTIDVKNGWNLIGGITTQLPSANITSMPDNIVVSNYFSMENGYYVESNLQPGRGYWVKVNQDGQLILDVLSSSLPPTPKNCELLPPSPAGEPASPVLLSPTDGAAGVSITPTLSWNASSGATTYRLQVSTNSNFTTLVFNDSTITTTSKQVGTLSYYTTYYWRVNAKNVYGTSLWSCAWQFRTRSQPNPCGPIETLSALDQFDISDANGGNQTLYIHNASQGLALGLLDFELPPMPPKGIFHARFNSNKFIESIPAGQPRKNVFIKVQDVMFPIAIQWDIKQENQTRYWLIKQGGRVELTGSGSFKIDKLDNGQIILQAESQPCENPLKTVLNNPLKEESPKKPSKYLLGQNLPNPFNPSTTIQYELPEEVHVIVKVYTTLGQEIATLVDEIQNAGYKSVNFDASSLPSGVYFYRLQAGRFVEMKKMLLMK